MDAAFLTQLVAVESAPPSLQPVALHPPPRPARALTTREAAAAARPGPDDLEMSRPASPAAAAAAAGVSGHADDGVEALQSGTQT